MATTVKLDVKQLHMAAEAKGGCQCLNWKMTNTKDDLNEVTIEEDVDIYLIKKLTKFWSGCLEIVLLLRKNLMTL